MADLIPHPGIWMNVRENVHCTCMVLRKRYGLEVIMPRDGEPGRIVQHQPPAERAHPTDKRTRRVRPKCWLRPVDDDPTPPAAA